MNIEILEVPLCGQNILEERSWKYISVVQISFKYISVVKGQWSTAVWVIWGRWTAWRRRRVQARVREAMPCAEQLNGHWSQSHQMLCDVTAHWGLDLKIPPLQTAQERVSNMWLRKTDIFQNGIKIKNQVLEFSLFNLACLMSHSYRCLHAASHMSSCPWLGESELHSHSVPPCISLQLVNTLVR